MSEKLKNERSLIELRRGKTLELIAQGLSQQEISSKLGVSAATVSLDLQYLKCSAREIVKQHVEEDIPYQYQVCHAGLCIVLRKAWEVANNPNSRTTEQIQALSLISDTYDRLMNLSTDSNTLERAIEWITKKKQELTQEEESKAI